MGYRLFKLLLCPEKRTMPERMQRKCFTIYLGIQVTWLHWNKGRTVLKGSLKSKKSK